MGIFSKSKKSDYDLLLDELSFKPKKFSDENLQKIAGRPKQVVDSNLNAFLEKNKKFNKKTFKENFKKIINIYRNFENDPRLQFNYPESYQKIKKFVASSPYFLVNDKGKLVINESQAPQTAEKLFHTVTDIGGDSLTDYEKTKLKTLRKLILLRRKWFFKEKEGNFESTVIALNKILRPDNDSYVYQFANKNADPAQQQRLQEVIDEESRATTTEARDAARNKKINLLLEITDPPFVSAATSASMKDVGYRGTLSAKKIIASAILQSEDLTPEDLICCSSLVYEIEKRTAQTGPKLTALDYFSGNLENVFFGNPAKPKVTKEQIIERCINAKAGEYLAFNAVFSEIAGSKKPVPQNFDELEQLHADLCKYDFVLPNTAASVPTAQGGEGLKNQIRIDPALREEFLQEMAKTTILGHPFLLREAGQKFDHDGIGIPLSTFSDGSKPGILDIKIIYSSEYMENYVNEVLEKYREKIAEANRASSPQEQSGKKLEAIAETYRLIYLIQSFSDGNTKLAGTMLAQMLNENDFPPCQLNGLKECLSTKGTLCAEILKRMEASCEIVKDLNGGAIPADFQQYVQNMNAAKQYLLPTIEKKRGKEGEEEKKYMQVPQPDPLPPLPSAGAQPSKSAKDETPSYAFKPKSARRLSGRDSMSADLYVLNLRNAGAPDNHPKLVEAQKHLREQIISQKTLQKYREELRDLNREASENSENSRSFLTPKRYGGIGIRSDDEFVGGICTATITDVFEDSPAKFAGLKPGDQLIIPAKTYKESIEKIRDEGIKKSGSIQVRRNGKVIDIEIKTAIMNYDRSRRTGALDNFGYSRQMDEKVRGG